MKFLKRLLESRPLTLPELISLNRHKGLYKGEILAQLKNVVFFIGLAEQPTGPVNFDDPTLQFMVWNLDGRGWLLLTFVDQVSLQQTNATSFPYMIDIRGVSKLMKHPAFLGMVVISGKEHATLMKHELTPMMNKLEK